MENHSDNESTQILGDWDSPPPPVRGGGRVLPPWADPSYEWGGGKWKEDGRKKKKKKKESLEDLMNEYLRCLLDLVKMGYLPSTNDYGSCSSIDDEDVLSLRILEFLFDPTKNDAAVVLLGPRIEFDLSLSSTHVLHAILKHITVSELRPGMPELSQFNLLPFIAHKNMSFPQCALLNKLRDVCAMENHRTSAAPTVLTDPVYYRDYDQPEQQAHTRLDQTNKDKVVEGAEVVVVIDGTAEQQPINNNGYTTTTTMETSFPISDLRVKCTKDGAWLICGSDDESDTGLVKTSANIPPRPDNVCWKCERQGGGGGELLLLICSRSECATKVHKECLNCQVHFDEDYNFYCPMCWYDRMTMEYIESDKLMHSAKRRLLKFLPLLSRASKRLMR